MNTMSDKMRQGLRARAQAGFDELDAEVEGSAE